MLSLAITSNRPIMRKSHCLISRNEKDELIKSCPFSYSFDGRFIRTSKRTNIQHKHAQEQVLAIHQKKVCFLWWFDHDFFLLSIFFYLPTFPIRCRIVVESQNLEYLYTLRAIFLQQNLQSLTKLWIHFKIESIVKAHLS